MGLFSYIALGVSLWLLIRIGLRFYGLRRHLTPGDIDDYYARRLDRSASSRVAGHVAKCEACRERFLAGPDDGTIDSFGGG